MKNNTSILTCIVLTYNEEIHIRRCLESLIALNVRILVIDSYSTDATLEIAAELGAEIYQNKFINHANQIQWAIKNCNLKSEWIFRLDCDEYIGEDLKINLINKLSILPDEASGILLRRRVHFMNRWIKRGGYYPIWILRIWKPLNATVEQRWMDEYVRVNTGTTISFEEDFMEENLNNLSWWTIKHDNYANREVADFIRWKITNSKKEHQNDRGSKQLNNQWAKWNLYYKLPLLLRPFIYFFYRYFFKLGFMDGKPGLIWHLLQGFWYRFLVDAKYIQLRRRSRINKESIEETLFKEFGIKIEE